MALSRPNQKFPLHNGPKVATAEFFGQVARRGDPISLSGSRSFMLVKFQQSYVKFHEIFVTVRVGPPGQH